MTRTRFCLHTATIVGGLFITSVAPIVAQERPARPARPERPARPDERPETAYVDRRFPGRAMYFNVGGADRDRGYLGVTPNPRVGYGPADTVGLLLADVAFDSPALKAGIGPGSRLVSIDGIDLRMIAADLGDDAAAALPESRLRRHLSRKQPGDTVALVVVLADGRRETKRVALAESEMTRSMRSMREGRRVLGVSFSQRGSMRDTAGLLITSIVNDGAADKAGLHEGDRLISIDGVDLRVPAADADTPEGVEARISRLRRQLDAAKDSQPVRLEVLSDGRRRTVSVTPTRERGWTFSTGDFAAMANGIRGDVLRTFDDPEVRAGMLRARVNMQRDMARAGADVERAQSELARALGRSVITLNDLGGGTAHGYLGVPEDAMNVRVPRRLLSGRTNGATLMLPGITLAMVDKDFAQTLGAVTAEGALVVRANRDWSPLKAGDVIMSIETRKVRDGDELDVRFDRAKDQRVEIVRAGRLEMLTIPASRP
jgi:PDZ domain